MLKAFSKEKLSYLGARGEELVGGDFDPVEVNNLAQFNGKEKLVGTIGPCIMILVRVEHIVCIHQLTGMLVDLCSATFRRVF